MSEGRERERVFVKEKVKISLFDDMKCAQIRWSVVIYIYMY